MVQAALRFVDSWHDIRWREKQRMWRQQRREWRAREIQFRSEEILLREEEQDFFQAKLRWREEDMKQRKVDNSRYQWNSFSERNRRDVEEKSEQFRSISWLGGLVTTFSMTTPVEFGFPAGYIPNVRVSAFAVFASLVPTLMVTSTMICVHLLGCILGMGKQFVAVEAEEEFMKQCCCFAENDGSFQAPRKPRQTFERFWDIRVNNYWEKALNFFFWGIYAYLALLCAMSFIKFVFAEDLAIIYTSITGVAFFICLGAHLTWGSYLRQTEPKRPNVLNSNTGCQTHNENNGDRDVQALPGQSV